MLQTHNGQNSCKQCTICARVRNGTSQMKKIFVSATLILVSTLMAIPARCTEPTPEKNQAGWLHEIRVGVLAHDVDGLWSGSRREDGIDINGELIFSQPVFSLLSGNVRPNLGVSVNTQGDTSKLYGGMLWQLDAKSGMFLDLGLGAALHDGELETSDEDKKALGSRILFRVSIEVGYGLNEHHRISILFDHVSNGYFADPNEGLDTLGLRYGYRF